MNVSVAVWLHVGVGGLFQGACVSALLSVSLVCLEMAVWVGKSLCVSEL